MSKQQGLRQRKKRDSNNNKSKGIKESATNSTDARASDATIIDVGLPESETLSETFLQHPLVKVGPIVLLPYIIYNIVYFVTLRHPEIVAQTTFGLKSLRPSLKADELRQVLIIGPEMPENRFVSGGMASPLGLEIVHEAFDAQNYFCRDGTVSWFQVMRFLDPLTETSNKKYAQVGAWKELCIDRNHTSIELFHPKEYGPSECDSYYALTKWSNCWAQKCLSIVKSIWACENDSSRECPQKFSRILHQVRHPMRTIETLNASVCPYPTLKVSFLNVVAGFFPRRDWHAMPCLNAMAWYTVDFHQLLIKARKQGLVEGVFQIEKTSPCEVAKMAGFVDEETAVYKPNSKKTTRACRDDDVHETAQSQDTFEKVKKENRGDLIPGLKPVTLKEFQDVKLAKEVEKLVSTLGYAKEGDSEFLV